MGQVRMEHDIGSRVFAWPIQTQSFKTKSQETFSKKNQQVDKSWQSFEITYYQTNLRITLKFTNRTLIFYTLNDSQIEFSNYLKAILRLKLFLSQPQVISKMSQNYPQVVQNFIFILCAPKQPKFTSAVSLGIKSSSSEV